MKSFFDYIDFPSENKHANIKQSFFNTEYLALDIEPFLKLNNLTKTIKADFFDSKGLFYTVNKDIREKVRRYNNDILYLTMPILRMVNYYELMNISTGRDKILYERLFRISARCVCVEIFMYEEKIKSLVRFILHIPKQSKRKYDDFIKQVRKKSKNNICVQNFIKVKNKYNKNSSVAFIRSVRNNEIHNDSVLDEYTDVQTLAQGVTSICDTHYAIDSKKLYNDIQQALKQQVLLKNSLQSILDNYKLKGSI